MPVTPPRIHSFHDLTDYQQQQQQQIQDRTTPFVDANSSLGDLPSHNPMNMTTHAFFLENVDAQGQGLPADLPFESIAKRIAPVGECFFFDYGVVVIWGLSEPEELRILEYLKAFEEEPLDPDDVETEELHYHYNPNCQPRIYNDVITLKVCLY